MLGLISNCEVTPFDFQEEGIHSWASLHEMICPPISKVLGAGCQSSAYWLQGYLHYMYTFSYI